MRVRPALIAAALALAAAAASGQTAVFVVRHAEKISNEDERLSEAGRARAAHLARMLANAGISGVYATNTERATDTAKPLADALGRKVRIYDEVAPFVETLRKEHAKQAVLVVGHSNTVPQILKALGCAEAVTTAEYDDLFVVVPKSGSAATLIRIRY